MKKKRVSKSNIELYKRLDAQTLISQFNSNLKEDREFRFLNHYNEEISFRINDQLDPRIYINFCPSNLRGWGRKYVDFPTISMHRDHLVDMAKLILQILEPESLIESEHEELVNKL